MSQNQTEFEGGLDEPTVLIVSAREQLRDHYASALGELNVRVLAVNDGFEAIHEVHAHSVHTIFTDFYLPGMSALELFLTLKELHFTVPLIICANDLSPKTEDELLTIGVFQVLRRASEKRDIAEAIRLALEERERQMLQFFC